MYLAHFKRLIFSSKFRDANAAAGNWTLEKAKEPFRYIHDNVASAPRPEQKREREIADSESTKPDTRA